MVRGKLELLVSRLSVCTVLAVLPSYTTLLQCLHCLNLQTKETCCYSPWSEMWHSIEEDRIPSQSAEISLSKSSNTETTGLCFTELLTEYNFESLETQQILHWLREKSHKSLRHSAPHLQCPPLKWSVSMTQIRFLRFVPHYLLDTLTPRGWGHFLNACCDKTQASESLLESASSWKKP